jgi:hypothetical protein
MMARVGKMIIRRAVPDDASGIARVCAEGWRNTYHDIYATEEIEEVIADYYTPERITEKSSRLRGGMDGSLRLKAPR